MTIFTSCIPEPQNFTFDIFYEKTDSGISGSISIYDLITNKSRSAGVDCSTIDSLSLFLRNTSLKYPSGIPEFLPSAQNETFNYSALIHMVGNTIWYNTSAPQLESFTIIYKLPLPYENQTEQQISVNLTICGQGIEKVTVRDDQVQAYSYVVGY